MPKFIVIWNCGYGDEVEVVEAESADEANMEAYERWREEAESSAMYKAIPYTQEDAEEYDVVED